MDTCQLDFIRCVCGKDEIIRRETIYKQYIMNGYPAGTPLAVGHEYFCNNCGRKLTRRHSP